MLKTKDLCLIMSYNGMRVRTRGGRGRGFVQNSVYSTYKRSDQNVFEVLSDLPQDDDCINFVDEGVGVDADGFTLVRKRQRVNTGGRENCIGENFIYNGEADFESMSTDEKLSTIFATLMCAQSKLTKVEEKVDSINRLNGRVQRVETVICSQNDRLKLLEYKSIDSEARSRRNNLVFRGLNESRDEDCRRLMCKFLEEKLGFDELPGIERAHRLGKFNRQNRGPRPVIVAFSFYRDTEDIISSARSLKGTPYSINRDYPTEITNARKELWSKFKEARNVPYNRVSIGYPAKLIVNGTVTCDLFPDWDLILRGSRVPVTPVREEYQTFQGPQTGPINGTSYASLLSSNLKASNAPI